MRKLKRDQERLKRHRHRPDGEGPTDQAEEVPTHVTDSVAPRDVSRHPRRHPLLEHIPATSQPAPGPAPNAPKAHHGKPKTKHQADDEGTDPLVSTAAVDSSPLVGLHLQAGLAEEPIVWMEMNLFFLCIFFVLVGVCSFRKGKAMSPDETKAGSGQGDTPRRCCCAPMPPGR